MSEIRTIFAAFLAVACLCSCDEGDITTSDSVVQASGKTAIVTANISGVESWGQQYSIVLAAFTENSDNALLQKQVATAGGTTATGAQGSPTAIETSMKLTSDDIATIELCVTNRLRQRIATFASISLSQTSGDTIRLDASDVDADMFGTIQRMVFTPTCARCHGLGTTAAAGLTLAESQSYEQLVGHASSNPERGIRVVPGDAEGSLLHKVLHGSADAKVHFDHNNMVKESSTLTMIDNWINGLSLSASE